MLVDKPQNWTQGQWDDFLTKINQCISKREAHWESYYIYNKYDTLINLPTIMISSLLSTLSVSHLAQKEQEDEDNAKIYNYIMVVSSISLTILTTVSKFFNFGQLKELHKTAGTNYEKIRGEFIQYVENRENNVTLHDYNEFIKMYYIKINNIRETEPFINKSKKEKWKINNNNTLDTLCYDNSPPVSETSTEYVYTDYSRYESNV